MQSGSFFFGSLVNVIIYTLITLGSTIPYIVNKLNFLVQSEF